jgi:acyl-coenzyme A thioesterase PaaI-like protein
MKRITPFRFKTVFNYYPPLFINRTKVVRVTEDFQEVDVKLYFSIMNRNFNGSTFGGSIFMAADAYYPIMYRAALSHRNIASLAWLKQAEISYLKPARSHLLYEYRLTDEDMDAAEAAIKDSGRFQEWHTVEAVDEEGDVCARVRLLSYLKSVG